MIQDFCDKFIAARPQLEAQYAETPPASYESIFTDVVQILHDADGYDSPDPERITVVNHGDYQGTLMFLVAAQGYQPSVCWVTLVSYGSCSGCDTFEAIQSDHSIYSRDKDDRTPERSESAAKQFAELALHMVQQMVQIGASW